LRRFNALRRIRISDTNLSDDTRLIKLSAWIDSLDSSVAGELVSASDDASFRRYFRLHGGPTSFIAMDAPPTQEDCLPFVRVAGYLEAMGLNAPRVVAAEIENGFLLLSDLGSDEYLAVLRQDRSSAPRLYGDAIDALLQIQSRGVAYQSLLPPYDETLLRSELALFRNWLCSTHLQLELSDTEQRDWQACCDLLVSTAAEQPRVFVHRDYHSRNLMVTAEGNPGILDFQDAVEGPFTYDLVSLLKDCYVGWPATQVMAWALDFHRKLAAHIRERVDESQFRRYFELMGVHRHLKAAGIFCRLMHRDGKSRYLRDVPRTLAYIVQLDSNYDELKPLIQLIEKRILPALSVAQ
jgi:aminoglycoside/choline kinase family phosphotransferase